MTHADNSRSSDTLAAQELAVAPLQRATPVAVPRKKALPCLAKRPAPPPPLVPVPQSVVCDLRQQGSTIAEIAEKTRLSRTQVIMMLSESRLFTGKVADPKARERIATLEAKAKGRVIDFAALAEGATAALASGMSMADYAASRSVGYTTVRNALRRASAA